MTRRGADESASAFARDAACRGAVERKIELISEAPRRLTRAFRDQHPQVPWRIIMARRYILAHDYDEVDNDIVWRIVTGHIPPLVEQLHPQIPPQPPVQE